MTDESGPEIVSPAEHPEQFSSAAAAFTLAPLSYSLMLQRFEAGHARLMQIATAVPTIVFAALAFVLTAAPHRDLHSPLLIVALVCAALSTAVCWIARFWFADFWQMDPSLIWDSDHLFLPEAAFQAYAVGWAGEHFRANKRTTAGVYYSALLAIVLFGVGMAVLTAWALRQL